MNTKALRQKVLDLAIHGKLVPQNPYDESATVLLEKIRAEKAEKIKKGELKADKKDSFIFVGSDKRHYEQFADGTVKDIEDEIPFDLPDGWAWCRLNELAEIARGGSPRPIENYITDSEDGINWIKIGDTAPESKYIISAREKIKPEGQKHSRFVHAGDFLLTNSMSFGRPYILKIDGCIHDGWLVFANIKDCIIKDYLYYALSSDYIYNSFSMVAAGSTVKNLKSDTVKQVLFPLPPIQTQERIIESIEKSFSQIGIIENDKSDLETVIKQTKSKILDLAIHGKLVPQDPNDEPAVELLKRIATSDNRPYEKVEEEPFEIPDSWKWVKLSSICNKLVDGDHNPPKGVEEETEYIMASSRNINYDRLDDLENVRYLTKEVFDIENNRTKAEKGDIFFTSVGTIGRSCIYSGNYNICFQRSVTVLNTKINNQFLKYFFDSNFFQTYVIEHSTGTAQMGFYLKEMSNSPISIPPIDEQDRIVAKVSELFLQLDQIQNNLI